MTTPLEERMARLEGAYEQINIRLGRVETVIDQLRQEMRAGFDRLDARIDRLVITVMVGIAATILATVLTRLI